MGDPTLAIAMIVVGAQIYKLGKDAIKFNLNNILIAFNRLILIPFVLFLFSYLIKDYFSKEIIGIFMIVNVMPVSVISVSMAIRYNSDPDLAAQNILFKSPDLNYNNTLIYYADKIFFIVEFQFKLILLTNLIHFYYN